ncbi:peptidase inhibitor family I36 protein [Streptomyces sp. NPDC058000]|uniref:peptidase inhibitor family I36 protein n=1 Tax=Streptomyces sp. NPDC058000 TaxID=3346299 RepID=UPI0036DFB0DF
MRRMRAFAVASAALAVVFGLAPTATAAHAAPTHRASYRCTPGYFCIYSNWNGGGTRCQWSQRSKANTADDCSFIRRGQRVRSVWNGTGHRVQYYTQTNYHGRVGSTRAGSGGNLQGNYQIRSFKPQ